MGKFAQNVCDHHDIKRLYFSNSMRIYLHCVSNSPIWESEFWKQHYPELSNFLINLDSDYGKTEEDYIIIMNQFYDATKKMQWIKRGLRKRLKKEIEIEQYLKRRKF